VAKKCTPVDKILATPMILMNVSEAIRQLSRRPAFNLRNLGLFGIELKPAVVGLGRKFAVEQG